MIARLALCLILWAGAAKAAEPSPLPSFAQLEARGARIGAIHIRPDNIFDLRDPEENGAFFQFVNALHIRTREEVIRETLLFRQGDPVSVRLIDETERLFRTKPYIYDVDIRPTAYVDGVVDIEVVTRDTWTLDLTGKVSRSGGVNSTAFGVKDENFLGTGTVFGVEQVSDPDVSMRVSCAKLFCTEMAGRVADRGVQVHGGAGYINEYPVERFYRDVRLLRLYEGTTQIQQIIVGRELMNRD